MRIFVLLLLLSLPGWPQPPTSPNVGTIDEHGHKLQVWAYTDPAKVEFRIYKSSYGDEYATFELTPKQWEAFKQDYASAWLTAERLKQGSSRRLGTIKELAIYAVHTEDLSTAVKLKLEDGREVYITKKYRSLFGDIIRVVDQKLAN